MSLRATLSLLVLTMTTQSAIVCTALGSSESGLTTKAGTCYELRGGDWVERVGPGSDEVVRVNSHRIVFAHEPGFAMHSLAQLGPAVSPIRNPLPEGLEAVDVPIGEGVAYLQKIERMKGIRWAAFDPCVEFFSVPNDPLYSQQWHMDESAARVPSAWTYVTGSPSVLVAIIDGGCDVNHPDLAGVIDPASYMYYPGPVSSDYHGIAVAGIVAANTNNGIGVAGVAGGWNGGGVRLLILNVTTGAGASDIAAALVFAADHGAKVANISAGWIKNTGTVQATISPAIAYATDSTHDMVICCSSGNNESQIVAYPASDGRTVAVGAVSSIGERHGGWGPALDVLAPGHAGILTTYPTSSPYNSYSCDPTPLYCFGGTSASSPFAAGVAALVRSANPGLSWSSVREILRHSADKLPGMNGYYRTDEYGWGKVNALGAVVAALYDAQLLQGSYTVSETWPSPAKPFHNLFLSGDVRVEAGSSVTISPGTQLYMATTDAADLEFGFADKVELIVKGALNLSGSMGSRIVLRSAAATPTEHDWAHVYVIDSGSLTASFADVRDSQNGIVSSSTGTLALDNLALFGNLNEDLKVGGVPTSATVSNCTFTVGGGIGAEVQGGSPTITGCTFVGNSSSAAGVKVEGVNATPSIIGNTFSGFSSVAAAAGEALWLGTGSATVVQNTVTSSNKAIYLTGGPHNIGTDTAGSGNTFSGYTTGIYVQCGGPGACPSVCASNFARVRRNTFSSSTATAVFTAKTSSVNLGDTSSQGLNTFAAAPCVINNSSSCGTIEALGNWWGSCASSGNLCGSVDAAGYLCSPPQALAPTHHDVVGAEARVTIQGVTPNPARRGATVHVQLESPSSNLELTIVDASGRRVATVRQQDVLAGGQSLRWDGLREDGTAAPAGIYFARVVADRETATTKVLVVVDR